MSNVQYLRPYTPEELTKLTTAVMDAVEGHQLIVSIGAMAMALHLSLKHGGVGGTFPFIERLQASLDETLREIGPILHEGLSSQESVS